jgi:uncharacterized membrane protein
VQESVEVQAPAADVFRTRSNFENFSTFVASGEEARMTCEDTRHWSVKGPLGKSIQFEAKTTQMDPERGIGRNTSRGDVMTSGEARLEEVAPGRTRIDVTMN